MAAKMNLRDKLEDDTLDLSLCDLQEVPVREIAVIRRATHLDLSDNRLISLPKSFITLTQVVKLNLSKNMLTEIPENFGEMRQLKHLDLYSNQISRLPLSLGELKNLKWLDLKENPLTPAVASVAGPCSDASDCQACARNVVAYLANIKCMIEEKKQHKANATTTESEKDTVPSKKDGKKKKKKVTEKDNKSKTEKQKSAVQKGERQNNNDDALTTTRSKADNKYTKKSTTRKGGVVSALCRTFTLLIIWLIILSFLSALTIAILPLIDKPRSDTLTKYLELQTGLPVKQYQQLGTKYVEMWTDNAVLLANRTQIFVKDTFAYYFEEVLTTSKKEL